MQTGPIVFVPGTRRTSCGVPSGHPQRPSRAFASTDPIGRRSIRNIGLRRNQSKEVKVDDIMIRVAFFVLVGAVLFVSVTGVNPWFFIVPIGVLAVAA